MASEGNPNDEAQPDSFDFFMQADGTLGWRWIGTPTLTPEQAAIVVQADGWRSIKLALQEVATALGSIADWMPENVAERHRP